jgi:cob(I)alamin adenosyltransferase
MAHRLSKITTRTGDRGETGLGDGSRVAKSSPRVRALGDVDELNSAIGLLVAEQPPAEIAETLGDVQHDLFDLGGELSIPGHSMLGDAQIERLEARIEAWNAELAPLKEFILPGGAPRAHRLPARRAQPGRAE